MNYFTIVLDQRRPGRGGISTVRVLGRRDGEPWLSAGSGAAGQCAQGGEGVKSQKWVDRCQDAASGGSGSEARRWRTAEAVWVSCSQLVISQASATIVHQSANAHSGWNPKPRLYR